MLRLSTFNYSGFHLNEVQNLSLEGRRQEAEGRRLQGKEEGCKEKVPLGI
ncbi:MAG: hypothetical protein F6K14_21695 [Symploca sp. SIO2C1]|nr:hypothetical protein [Symploca sp. SIO2C1]